jgi:prophage regulatory protein
MSTPANDNSPPVLMSMNEAVRATSLSRTMLNRYRAEGRFPVAVPLGDRRFAFVRSEVNDWIEDRIARRGATEQARAAA